MKIKCDYEGCGKDSVGYVDRQLQGPFYCEEHEKWAVDIVHMVYSDWDAYQNQEVTDGE